MRARQGGGAWWGFRDEVRLVSAQDFRGYPACECLVEWLPVYERLLQVRGVLQGPLRIYQLIGQASASANTHSEGGAFDICDLLDGGVDVEVARQMGADATWARTAAQGFSTPHLHGVLTDCPHNGPARYQIDAVRAGCNGLGKGGRGGTDDGPRPLSGRTWRQGIAWAMQEIDRLEDDEMKPEDWDRLEKLIDDRIEAAWNKKLGNGVTRETNLRRAGDTKGIAQEVVREMKAVK